MPKLCVFHGPQEELLYVNPMLVRILRTNGPTGSIVEFDDNHLRSVELPIDEVRKALDKAMNDDKRDGK